MDFLGERLAGRVYDGIRRSSDWFLVPGRRSCLSRGVASHLSIRILNNLLLDLFAQQPPPPLCLVLKKRLRFRFRVRFRSYPVDFSQLKPQWKLLWSFTYGRNSSSEAQDEHVSSRCSHGGEDAALMAFSHVSPLFCSVQTDSAAAESLLSQQAEQIEQDSESGFKTSGTRCFYHHYIDGNIYRI